MEAILASGGGRWKLFKFSNGGYVGGGGRSLPSANPDNVAAGGATDAPGGGGGEEGWRGADNSS